MSLNSNPIEELKQIRRYFFGVQENSLLVDLRVGQRGFTLIELIMVMIIVGILAVVVAPRFFDANVFKSRGFADQVQATLRYAQKQAIAQHRNVCVTMTANTITLTIANASGAGVACGTNLNLPTGGSNILSVPLGSGITLTSSPVVPPVSFGFNALGATAVQQTITVSGATNSIVVEAETGYVHSP